MNLDIYTSEMAKSIWDKSFFMDKIPGVKCIIDFGCADGAMIRFLGKLFPDIYFVGYDFSSTLIARAQSTAPFLANVAYFSHYTDALDYITLGKKFKSDEICINFSSVLHEVYSSTGGIADIGNIVADLNPKYITIRDMYCDDKLQWNSDFFKILAVVQERDDLCEYAKQFAKTWGALRHWDDLIHLLMKLQWIDNGWEDELKENYFSWNIDDFIKDIGGHYHVVFDTRYQLPYLTELWEKEYNWHNPDIHTHAQFILRRDN